jgi:hypothetical protein
MGDLGALVAHPEVRRIEVAWGLSTVAWTGGTVATLVLAYQLGGAALVAGYAVARAVLGGVASILLAGFADHVRRDRLLRLTVAARAALVASAAGLAVSGTSGPAVAVVALVVVADGLAVTFRPLQAASLPWLVRTPGELTAANVAATVMESTGTLAGPLLAGVGLYVSSAQTTLGLSAVPLALASWALWGLRLPEESRAVEHPERRRMLGELVAGGRDLVRLRPTGGVAVLAFLQTFARGVLTVALVVLVLDVLVLDEGAVGWLNAALGVGGLLGGLVGASVVRTTRLGRSFVAGVALWGVGLSMLALWPHPAVAALSMVICGVGNAVEDAGVFTLLPRLVEPSTVGRLLGAFELLILSGVALGSLAFPLLEPATGVRGVLGLVGGALLLACLGWVLGFARLDRTAPRPSIAVSMLRAVPMFAPLPLVGVEQLAGAMETRSYAAGDQVVREGERGRHLYVVTAGRATVQVHGRPRPALGPGDCFGEIALLGDGVRTATVVAEEELTTMTLEREAFLRAITGNAVSGAAARALAERRLAADPR